MFNQKRKKLFPIPFKIKKYGIELYRIGYCCGMDYFIPTFLLRLIFVFKDKYYWHCDQCGKTHCIKLVSHTVPYYDKDIRENNKKLEVFRNG